MRRRPESADPVPAGGRLDGPVPAEGRLHAAGTYVTSTGLATATRASLRRTRLLAGALRLGDPVANRRQVAPLRNLLLAMVVFDSVATYVWVTTGLAIEGNPLVAAAMDRFGDALGLGLRTSWSAGLVVALTWIGQRRSQVRPALLFVLLVLGAVTLVHVLGLALVWSRLLG